MIFGVAFIVCAALHLVKNAAALKKILARRSTQLALGAVTVAVVLLVVVGGGKQHGPRTRPPVDAAAALVHAGPLTTP